MKKKTLYVVAVLVSIILSALITAPIVHGNSTLKLRLYEWTIDGEVKDYVGGLDYLRTEIKEKVESEMNGQVDETDQPITIKGTKVDLVKWVETSSGRYDVQFKTYTQIIGMFTSGSLSAFLIGFIKAHLWAIIQYIVAICILIIIVKIVSIIFEPQIRTEHYVKIDPETGQVIEEWTSIRPTYPWEDARIFLLSLVIVLIPVAVVSWLALKRRKK